MPTVLLLLIPSGCESPTAGTETRRDRLDLGGSQSFSESRFGLEPGESAELTFRLEGPYEGFIVVQVTGAGATDTVEVELRQADTVLGFRVVGAGSPGDRRVLMGPWDLGWNEYIVHLRARRANSVSSTIQTTVVANSTRPIEAGEERMVTLARAVHPSYAPLVLPLADSFVGGWLETPEQTGSIDANLRSVFSTVDTFEVEEDRVLLRGSGISRLEAWTEDQLATGTLRYLPLDPSPESVPSDAREIEPNTVYSESVDEDDWDVISLPSLDRLYARWIGPPDPHFATARGAAWEPGTGPRLVDSGIDVQPLAVTFSMRTPGSALEFRAVVNGIEPEWLPVTLRDEDLPGVEAIDGWYDEDRFEVPRDRRLVVTGGVPVTLEPTYSSPGWTIRGDQYGSYTLDFVEVSWDAESLPDTLRGLGEWTEPIGVFDLDQVVVEVAPGEALLIDSPGLMRVGESLRSARCIRSSGGFTWPMTFYSAQDPDAMIRIRIVPWLPGVDPCTAPRP